MSREPRAGGRHARPTSKNELITASARGYGKLMEFAASMTEGELAAPFDFSADRGRKEAHWSRDKNLRDVLAHLHEWHRLLLDWVGANEVGEKRLPAVWMQRKG